MITNKDYRSIKNKYNAFLERSITSDDRNLMNVGTEPVDKDNGDLVTPSSVNGSVSPNGSVETMPVKTSGAIGDIWIKNFIRSENWKPRKNGFAIDGQTGRAEFTNVYVSGEISALTGKIGGWTINATSLSATSIFLDSSNQKIQVGASEPVTIDGVTKSIQSDNYVSGAFGSGFFLDSNLLEVGNIAARGLIRTACFQRDVISSVGGNLVILNSDVLDIDMSSED